MALTDESGMSTTMLMTPASSGMPYPVFTGGGNNSGFGGDGWWIILLIIILAIGGGGWNGNNSGFTMPYAVDNSVQTGFNQAALTSSLGDIQTSLCNGFSNVQQSLCNGFAGVNATVNNGFANAETANNARQMANMQQMFNLSTQFADCCCENRLANCQTQNIIQNEGNTTRFADANNTRDIIQNQTQGTQAILDKLCQLELDAKNDKIGDLERQLTMANLAASQTAQTAQLLADNSRQTVALEQYLNPVPVPAYVVQNPNCCATNNCNVNCGCGIA